MFKITLIKNKVSLERNTLAAILLIIVLTSVVYVNSLKNSFVFDDYFVIVDNDFVKSWKNFPLIFSRDYLSSSSIQARYTMRNIGSGQSTYRPIITIFHFIDYSLWRFNPFGYHLTNLLLHITNVMLLYFFIGLIAKDKRIALLTSLFFGVHPINSESVNVIAYRGDLLFFLFFISSFILFIKSDYYDSRKRHFYYFASILLFLLALFSKEMAITLPSLLMVYDYYFVFDGKLKKFFSHFKSRYIGYIAASLFYLWVWFFLMGNIRESLVGYPGGNFYTNILTMSKVVAIYVKWLFIPIGIHATLPYDPSYVVHSFFTLEATLSISLITVCLVLAIVLYRRAKMVSFAIFWFFITLLPVLNIVPLIYIIASRYLYIPAVGFCLLVAVLLCRLPTLRIFSVSPNILQKLAKNTVIVLLIFYSVFTIARNFAWRNNIAYWLEMAEYYPDNPLPHRNLGACFKSSGLLDKAIDEFKIAISLHPYFAIAYYDLGNCYYEKVELDKAIDEFKKALELGLNWPDIYVDLAVCLIEKEDYKEAIDYLKQALKIDPVCVHAYYNLGVTYANMKNYDEAKRAWEKVLEIDPEFKDTKDCLKKLELLGS